MSPLPKLKLDDVTSIGSLESDSVNTDAMNLTKTQKMGSILNIPDVIQEKPENEDEPNEAAGEQNLEEDQQEMNE